MNIRLAAFCRRITRKRPVSTESLEDNGNGLIKCLSTVDLVSLGVGSCCGTGMYLTCGMVTQTAGGPGAIIAFMIAGFVSLLSGMCYAELASVCPTTSGSAYMYSYVTVGELFAYVIGWGLVAEYIIGTAAAAVALSATIDSICNFTFSSYFSAWGSIGSRPYFDILSVVICTVLTIVLISGVKLSTGVNNILNLVNLAVWLFFIGVSINYSESKNWSSDKQFPVGGTGVLKMLPIAYFAFIGFDCIACTGEEAKNPTKSIPKAIIISVLINVVAYSSVSTCLSLLIPATNLAPNTAMLDVFVQREAMYAKYIVSCGAVCGLFAATFGSMFPLPRILCAMAKDGLIFRQFGEISSKSKTPQTATLCSGISAITLALTVDLVYLIELVLMGTLLAYILVAVSVILLRYPNEQIDESLTDSETSDFNESRPDEQEIQDLINKTNEHELQKDEWNYYKSLKESCFYRLYLILVEYFQKDYDYVTLLLVTILILQVVISVVIVHSGYQILHPVIATLVLVLMSVLIVSVGLLAVFPQKRREQSFRAPFVPILPVLATFINIYLMVSVTLFSWILFAIWMIIGFIIYFTYCMKAREDILHDYECLPVDISNKGDD